MTDEGKYWDTDKWDVGWTMVTDEGFSSVDGPYFKTYFDTDNDAEKARILLAEVSRGHVPVQVILSNEDFRVGTLANIDAKQARDLGEALLECAKIAENYEVDDAE